MTTELAQDFAITVRGYDRAQVDSYVDTLREWLGNATLRMEAAEADNAGLREEAMRLRTRLAHLEQQVDANPPRTIEALGDRISRILLLAEEGAAAAEADAEAEAVAILGRARQEADDTIRSAQARQGEMEAFIAGAHDHASAAIEQAEARGAEAAHRLLTEAESAAAAREAESRDRARATVAEADAERDRILAELAEEKLAICSELRRLAAERDEVRQGLTRLKDSLHRTITDLPDAGGPIHRPEPAGSAAVRASLRIPGRISVPS